MLVIVRAWFGLHRVSWSAELSTRALRAIDDRFDRLIVVGVVDSQERAPAALVGCLLSAALHAAKV